MPKRTDLHRGRTKEGKKTISIFLTPEEWNGLKKLAEGQCRSATAQATWILLQEIARSQEVKRPTWTSIAGQPLTPYKSEK